MTYSWHKWHENGSLQAVKWEKGAWKVGERIGQTLEFSREFESLQAVKSEFSLCKLRVYCLQTPGMVS